MGLMNTQYFAVAEFEPHAGLLERLSSIKLNGLALDEVVNDSIGLISFAVTTNTMSRDTVQRELEKVGPLSFLEVIRASA